jgi:hypothetical protein
MTPRKSRTCSGNIETANLRALLGAPILANYETAQAST